MYVSGGFPANTEGSSRWFNSQPVIKLSANQTHASSSSSSSPTWMCNGERMAAAFSPETLSLLKNSFILTELSVKKKGKLILPSCVSLAAGEPPLTDQRSKIWNTANPDQRHVLHLSPHIVSVVFVCKARNQNLEISQIFAACGGGGGVLFLASVQASRDNDNPPRSALR